MGRKLSSATEMKGVTMPQDVTKGLLERIDAEFDAAKTAEDVRVVFKRHYSDLGWKRLCRLFVLQYGVDELWLAEEERGKKTASARGGEDVS